MNRDVRDRWVAALRSGDYVQGHRRLRGVGDGGVPVLCCLGVLCELAVAAGVARLDPETGRYHDADDHTTNGFNGVLSPAVRDWAGLRDPNPTVDHAPLSWWNDHGNASFGMIADKIARYL